MDRREFLKGLGMVFGAALAKFGVGSVEKEDSPTITVKRGDAGIGLADNLGIQISQELLDDAKYGDLFFLKLCQQYKMMPSEMEATLDELRRERCERT